METEHDILYDCGVMVCVIESIVKRFFGWIFSFLFLKADLSTFQREINCGFGLKINYYLMLFERQGECAVNILVVSSNGNLSGPKTAKEGSNSIGYQPIVASPDIRRRWQKIDRPRPFGRASALLMMHRPKRKLCKVLQIFFTNFEDCAGGVWNEFYKTR